MGMRLLNGEIWDNPATRTVDPDMNLPKIIAQRATKNPGQIAIEKRTAVGSWREIQIEEYLSTVEETARGLIGLGLEPGEHFAILAATSYEWAVFDLAALSCGAISVPIYETDSADQIQHILNDANIVMVVTATSQQADLVESVRTPSLRHIFSLDKGAERDVAKAAKTVSVESVRKRVDKITLHDEATIIYTSGTTGRPKGVVLTHGNFVEGFVQAYDFLPDLIDNPRSRSLLFLPVAHVLARFVMYALLSGNGRVAFSPDTFNLVSDIATFKPSLLLVVPRVLEKIYNLAASQANSTVKRTIFSWSVKQARQFSRATAYRAPLNKSNSALPPRTIPDATSQPSPGPSISLQLRKRIADALVLRKVKQVMGPNLKTVICGGAPLALDLAHFYRGLGVELLQGYGLSETTGPISVEIPEDFPPDSVGFVWPGNQMKLANDGELLVRGISVSPGYHNLPDATAEAYKDGWFHTGDLASLDDTGHLRITGRKKELIVTAGGKNVSPEILEDALQTHPLIGTVIVVGDGRPYIGALISLDPEMLPIWLTSKGHVPVDPTVAATLDIVQKSLDRAVARANRHVSRAESIRRYKIIDAAFTVENGYMTPSLKIKRDKVLSDFSQEVDALYAEGEREKTAK